MKKTVIALSILISAAIAQAKPYELQDLKSWNALKDMCKNHEEFGAQIPPTNIEVKCQTKRKYTGVIGSKQISFPSSGTMTATITSSKADVNPSSSSLKVQDVVVDCPIVAKFQQGASGTFPTTCEEIEGYTNTVADFCAEKLSGGSFEGAAEQIPGTEQSLCVVNQCKEEALD